MAKTITLETLEHKLQGHDWTFNYSDDYYVGRPSSLFSWIALDGTRYQSLGNDRKVYIYQSGTNADITPIRQSNSLTSVILGG